MLNDLRYAVRTLAKTPGFTAVAVLTLTLGIGANTAIFSVVNGVMLRPLGFPREDRLVQVTDTYPQGTLATMRESLHTLDVAGYRGGEELNLTGLGDPVRLHGAAVTANFFSVLGAQADQGRVFADGEDRPGSDRVIVLSHELGQQISGPSPNVVGRSLVLDGVSRQVVGVMPAGFPLASSQAQFWVPLHLDPRDRGAYWGSGFMPVVGRLRPGASLEQACAELRTLLPQLRRMFPWAMPDAIWASATVVPLRKSMVGDVRTKLLLLLAATSLVLLIACANVANLLLARAATRQKETAVRAALGAGRWRVCRQLFTESGLLGVAGGLGGLLLAAGALSWLRALSPEDAPHLAATGIDWRVLAFTAGSAVLTTLLFGSAPTFLVARTSLAEVMQAGRHSMGPASRRLRSALVVAELSLAVILATSAGLMARSVWELSRVDPGFRTESLLTARVTPSARICAASLGCRDLYAELLGRLRAHAAVQGAAFVNVLPLGGRIDTFAADLEDHPRDPRDPAPVMYESVVSPDYFQVMGIPLLRGRSFADADMGPRAAEVGVITAATAQKFWPNQEPLGKRVRRVADSNWVTIVGVVGDVNEYSLASRLPEFADGAILRPYGNGTGEASRLGPTQPIAVTLVVRTAGPPVELAGELRRIMAAVNPEVPLSEMETFSRVVSRSLAVPRSTMLLFALFAALAVLLGAIGVYGVASYGVSQLVPEIGVRMALGAHNGDVMRLVMGQGARLVLLGIAVGLAGALGVTRLLGGLLYGIKTTDALTYASVSILLTLVALAACYIPARRAAKVDPMVALRCE